MPKVEFHFDFGSPNAYLAHLVIPEIEQRTGVKFEYVPVLLGGVYKLTGNRSPAESAGAGERWTGAVNARGAIDAFLDAELKRLGLDDSKLALVGFSQGCMMALHVGLRRPRAPAGILGFSGLLVVPEHLSEAMARDARGAPPPILLIHGDQDPMIPFDAMFMAAEALAGASIPTQWHLSLGIGHGIDAEGLRQGGLFLAKAFADRRR